MRDGLVEDGPRACCSVLLGRIVCEADDPFRRLVAILVEVVEVFRHVLVVAVRAADGVARVAVFAQDASVSVGQQACVLPGSARCAAVGHIAPAVGEALVRGSSRGPEGNGGHDCERLVTGGRDGTDTHSKIYDQQD
jgi:hypothetical protein